MGGNQIESSGRSCAPSLWPIGRVMRAPSPCALTRTDAARLAEERQKEAVDAAITEYRRLSPFATGDLPSTPVTREWGRKSASQNVTARAS